jgi:ABC-type sugar transport system permease subunit
MQQSKKKRGALVKNRNAYFLIAPNIFFLMLFLIAPFVWVIVLSFQKGSVLGPKTFVGFANYFDLFRNKLLLKSILNTLKYTVTVIPSVFVVGMIVALLLHRIKKFRNFFRTLLFIPLLSSIVVAAIIWRYLVYPEYGPVSRILEFLHVPAPNWFGDAKVVIFTIVLVELWRGLPFYIVTFLAGLQSVPGEMVEASYIDGANYFQSLFHVVFPSMKPVLTFCLVMATIWALQLFDSVYVLTRGGPSSASSTIVWSIYENIFFFNRVGRGATMSVVLILLIALMTFVNLKITRFHEEQIV